jgi:hypothetical protein
MKRNVGVLVMLGILALLLAGCYDDYEGGGWLLSATGTGKASFGFYAESSSPEYSGEFQFRDHGAGFGIHGTFENEEGFELGDLLCIQFTWDKQGKKPADFPETGWGQACVLDNGEGANAPTEDWLEVSLWDDGDFVYFNAGPLGGGNIQEID